MSYAVKNGQTSVVLRVKLMDSSSAVGAGLTGLTSASSGLIISTIADNEASATAYTQAGSTIEAVTTLGTYAAPTASKCRFKEVDATNHKGIYEIQIADARFAVAGSKSLLISISGAANLAQCDYLVPLVVDDPYVAKLTSASLPSNFAALGISAGGHISNVDTLTTYTGNTPQTGDAYARIGAAGAGLTALGDARIGHLDADVSSRSTFAGGAVASVTGNVGGNVTGSVGSISGVSFPTHFSSLAIDVSGNVTFGNSSIATVTNLTNAPTAGDFTAAMKTSLNAATPASITGSVGSVTGLTASDVGAIKAKTDNLPAAPADESLIIAATNSLASSIAALPTTTTVNAIKSKTDSLTFTVSGVVDSNVVDWKGAAAPAMTGDAYARLGTPAGASVSADVAAVKGDTANIGIAGAGLTAIGDTRMAHLDADVSSRMATFTLPTHFSSLAIDVSGGVTFNNTSIATVTNLTNAPTSGNLTAAMKTDVENAVWNATMSGHVTVLTTGAALNAASSAGDPWATALPGAYGDGTAGKILGSNLDVAISTRLASSGYTAPDNADIASIKTAIGVGGAGLTALGDTRLAHLDADVSSRLATSSYTAPDNSDIAAIKAKTDNLPAAPADESLIIAATSSLATAIAALPTTSTVMPADIKKVNGTTIGGNGAGAPWGPA